MGTNSETTKSMCDGLGCSREAANSIEVYLKDKRNLTLLLCDFCVEIFHNHEKKLEQQVAEPVCSNTLNHDQSIQQHGVLLDD